MKLKRSLCLFITLVLLVTLCGCFNRIPGKIWQNPNLEDMLIFADVMIGDELLEEAHDNHVITRVAWQKLKLSEDSRRDFPELAATFDRENAERDTAAKAEMYELQECVELEEGDVENPLYLESESKFYPQRADNYIVSILEYNWGYTGGVHPNYGWSGRNYHPETGEEVALTDVMTDVTDLPSLLANKITEKYSDMEFFNLEENLSQYTPEDFTWTVDYQGITFWFSPYEIAAYAFGTLSARIWFDEAPERFTKEYLIAPEAYAVSVPLWLDMEFDLTADDGKRDSVSVDPMADQYGSYYMLSAAVNDERYTDEVNYAYHFDAYLVHMGETNYLYSDSTSDNDFHILTVLDLNDDTPQQIRQMSETGFYSEFVFEGEDGVVYRDVLIDPFGFRLGTRLEVLGVKNGKARYKVSETDGTPQMIDEAYHIEDGVGLKLKIPVEVQFLPNEAWEELPAGETLYPLRTDGKTYLDMKTEDGREVRVQYYAETYPHRINGIDEEAYFENLIYAG